ncbi:hypothetical protein E2L07_18225 [Halalkalibacterium halodurans]|uniref:hypothetical protein n=1 Tax=Halalkalibacterium halodurans TaxID=86665 RepID=UPI0010689C82|nr:hypothetical protein [Halalkalibacterium halodurans]TES48804.1 hypothetical protein E2L07_18225 [Halalkalibacterium halodurans]
MEQLKNEQQNRPRKKPSNFKTKKEQAEKILALKGVDYNEWLHSQHEKVITENLSFVLEAVSD